MGTIKIRATRNVMAGAGRELGAGQVVAVDALTAFTLVSLGAAALVDPKDAPAARAAFDADQRRIMREIARPPAVGSPWRPTGWH